MNCGLANDRPLPVPVAFHHLILTMAHSVGLLVLLTLARPY